ncbi:uncharacterized protein [Euwallacea similis]|uniref:uncharacterized protein n=1 Tax=Euwallacea similis TaxID=1736056 RepID=UPI0034509CDA
MGNDKIDTSMIDWIQSQEHPLAKMGVKKIRIEVGDQNYYGRVKFIHGLINIIPDNAEISVSSFTGSRLAGFIEVGQKALQLNPRFGRPCMVLHFRAPDRRNVAVKKLKALMGAEST